MSSELRIVDETGTVLADLDTATEGAGAFAPRAGSADSGTPVTDSIDLVLAGGTAALIRAVIEDVEQALALAARRAQNPASRRVFLEWQIADGADVWRTQIVPDAQGECGRMIYDKRQLSENWPGKVIEAQLSFVHMPYWEKTTETECATSNGGGGPSTGGRVIYNHDDAGTGHDDWLSIAGAQVAGDQPTPARVEITNTYASADKTHTLYIGHNVASDPANAPHAFEGESATSEGTLTPTADAGCSGGQYGSVAWTQVGTNEYKLFDWELTTAMLDALRAGYFRLLGRWFSQPYSDFYVRPKVLFGTSEIWAGEQLLLAQSVTLQELAARPLQLPPWPRTPGSAYPLHLALYCQRLAAAASTVGLDFAALMPTDSWLRLVPRGSGLPQNARIVHDGILGLTYEDGLATAGQYEGYTPYPYGAAVMLWPGEVQRLYVLVSNSANGSEIARTSSVRVYYRERRRVPV